MPDKLIVDHTDDQGRTWYEPVVAEVTGFSQYNKDQFSLGGIDGFWSVSPRLAEKLGPVAKGMRQQWILATKPKPPGPKTNPGSVYRDVMAIGNPADYQDVPELLSRSEVAEAHSPDGTPKAPAGAIGQDDQVPAEWTMPLAYYVGRNRERNRSIEKQVAAKIMAELAVAAIGNLALNDSATLQEITGRARDMAEDLWNGPLPFDGAGEAAMEETK